MLCATVLAQTSGPADATQPYLLGPEDQISIRILQAPELAEKAVRVDLSGDIELPFIGRVRAAGLSVEQLTKELTKRYSTYVRQPEVSIYVEEYKSQPVSVLGAVNTPGVQQIRGRKSLAEVIAMAGGIRQDSGNTIVISRRLTNGRLPLANAHDDPNSPISVASIDIKSLMEGRNPQVNIPVQPDDVISVPRAEMVYVVGDVQRAGGFVLTERRSMSILEALALAGGPNRTAAPQGAKVLRMPAEGQSRVEVEVNVKSILSGKAKDIDLRADDILFIPESAAKHASMRALEAAIQLGTGVAIYRR
jgi:polysaccharide export outer membrane protein